MALGYRPLVYMWVAVYEDGQALPQFDPETGKENMFAEVDQDKLKEFGLFPFSEQMARRIQEGEGVFVLPSDNQRFVLKLKEGQRLFTRRTNLHITVPYHECLECGHKWQWGKGDLNPYVDLPMTYLYHQDGDDIGSRRPKCPSCGYYNEPEANRKPELRRILRHVEERRRTIYKLGVQDEIVFEINEEGVIVNVNRPGSE